MVDADAAFLGMLDELQRVRDVSLTKLGKALIQLAETSGQIAAVYAGTSGSTPTVHGVDDFLREVARQLTADMNEVYVQYRRSEQ